MGQATRRKVRSFVFAAALATAVTTEARAFEFAWDTPAGCPSAAFVEAEVTRIVGRPWRELSGGWARVNGAVTADGEAAFRLRLSMIAKDGASSERSVTASSCTEATEAAVAILVAGIAPSGPASTEAKGNDRAVVLAVAAEAAAVATDRDAATVAEQSELAVTPLIAAELGFDAGSLVAIAPTVRVSAGLELHRFVMAAFVGATGRVLGELEGYAAGAQMFLVLGGAEGCYRLSERRTAISGSGCAGVELGSLEASGFGASEGRDGRALWSAAFARAALDWNVSHASVVSIGVTVAAPFRRLRVVLSPEEVHRASALAVRPFVGFGVRF